MRGVDTGRLVTLYEGGSPPSDLALQFKVSQDTVKRLLRKNGVSIRPQGRPVGWRKLDSKEIERRKRIALRSNTWERYRKKAGLPAKYNARLDRRYGVRLACFLCKTKVSTETGRINGYRRQLCRRCFRRLPK
ncbi:MAG TPA: helix-turn-helix domain-containing protein [Thermoplasmata archaeon]